MKKPDAKVQLMSHVPPLLKKAVKDIAKDEDRSESQMGFVLIKEAMDARGINWENSK